MSSVNSELYMHPKDRAALEALKGIPGFTTVLRGFMKNFSEQQLHGVNMATKLRLSKDQLPELYNILPPICEKLGIKEPEFYLEMNPEPNAYTYGDTQTFLTITSGLVECMNEEELKAVVAHECGHIACHHVLYHTMAKFILEGIDSFIGLGLISLPLKLALYGWQRMSELSADRAAAIYMGGSDVVEDVMIRLSAGSKSYIKGINKELYMQQAKDYEELVSDSGFDKVLQFLANMNGTHPFNSVRCSEIHKWCQTEEFKRILNGETEPVKKAAPEDEEEGVSYCQSCGAKLNKYAIYCPRCGVKKEQ